MISPPSTPPGIPFGTKAVQSVLSISLLPLPELAVPTLFPPEPFETDSGEEPGDDNGCEPLSDRPDKDIDKSFNDSEL